MSQMKFIRHLFLIVFSALNLSELTQSTLAQSLLENGKGLYKPATETNQGVIRKIGPSGKELIHNPRFSSVKSGKESAQQNILGRSYLTIKDPAHGKAKLISGTGPEQKIKDHHNKDKKGEKSTHSTDAKVNKRKAGIAYRIRRRG